MYLKRVELHGFKTFAARTVLDFEGGVTGVVGPNGSGKSNLADAVRWALGEQSLRQVRCRRAEDLIFAGTSAATPGMRGAARAPMGMAEVMLTFDNATGWLPVEYAEVRVGRRLYRTGENEYLLNGAKVRLRDVADLLARAAIGAGTHIVIGQGLVDTVLSQRPEERRALVETLAGLRFYYSRREDAEGKLRAAEANLRHVDAMIAEAGPHVALLWEQAAAYEAYHAVERELRDALLLHYAHAHAAAREKRERLGAEREEAHRALAKATAVQDAAEGAVAAARERLRALAEEIGALRGQVRGIHGEREGAERELAVSRARRESARTRLDELRAGLPEAQERRDRAERELREAETAARGDEQEHRRLRAASDEIERAVQAATLEQGTAERRLRSLAERRRALERQDATVAAELAALDRAETAARADEGRLQADEQATTKGLREAEAALATAREALAAATTRLEEARAADARARLLAATATERARTASGESRDCERVADQLRARAAGLRAWLEAAGGAGKAAGDGTPVAAMIAASPEVGTALAAALGPFLTARPVPAGIDATTAGALLDAGARGVLLPGVRRIDETARRAIERSLERAGIAREEIVGWGDALARVESDGRDEIGASLVAALSAVLVVRDAATLWRVYETICRDDGHTGPEIAGVGIVVATPGGEALLPNGLLHRPGGEGAAALERARELRAVEDEIRAAEERLNSARTREEQAEGERTRHVAAAEAAARAMRSSEHERAGRRGDVTAAERVEAQARRESSLAAERRQRAVRDTAERARRRAEVDERQRKTRADLDALANDEQPASARYERAREALAAATARRAEHGAALALVAGRAGDRARRLRAAQDALARADDELRARAADLERIERQASELDAVEEQAAARVAATSRQLQALHERLRPLDAERAALDEQVARDEARLAALRQEQSRAVAAHEASALALQRAEHELDTVTAGVHADLARDPIDLPPPTPLPSGLQGRIKSLRAQIAASGPVNARAPEDLAAATERQEFLQTQASDLREGIARLRGVIAEANGTLRERFGSVAGELDAQFRLYLQRLFGGGRGELTALYDESGLPSGLDIAVQPPGKRTRELSLLSGGERALVGLALVFAMLAVRPVPFCILDEAEAALDEANTLRVGEILRDLSARTQFVVITHNRGTMNHADALYGVTMAESGVSQVASLRLEDVEAVRRGRFAAVASGR